MKEVTIKGLKRFCFVVKSGPAADIVIPVDNLAPIDYKRLADMDAVGGELMTVMRDTTLDNGMNALDTYQNVLVVVEKDRKVAEKNANVDNVPAAEVTTEADAPPRRGPGRPKGSKNRVRS